MGEVASIIHSLSCTECARYVCNNASIHSQCCDDEDGCNCEVMTKETEIQHTEEDIEVSMDNGCDSLCCNCLVKAHK